MSYTYDNIRHLHGKFADDRQGGTTPWPSVAAAVAGIKWWRRVKGLEVCIDINGEPVWHIWKDKTDQGLIPRPGILEAPSNDTYLRTVGQWIAGVTKEAFESFSQWVVAEKEDTVIKQSTPPTHLSGRLWLDTSVTPNILKRSTGTAWVNASPTTAAQVGAFSATDGSALTTRVSTAETNITQTSNAIALKADQTTVDSVSAVANSKAKTFLSTPTTPYYVGDIWIDTNATTGGNRVCTTQRLTGAYVAGDWTKEGVTSRMDSAELRITPTAITSTVRSSTEYINDLGGKENTVFKQNTAPAHLDGRLWLDTSVTPNVLNRSTGTAWVPATPTTPAQVGAFPATDGNNLATRVSTAESSIVQNATAITNITSDNVLSAAEKPAQRLEWDTIAVEKTGINNQATTFGITTENTVYNDFFQILANYLNGGTAWVSGVPLWLTDAQLPLNTTIIGGQYRARWRNFYNARTALLNAITNRARELANTAQASADAAQTAASNAQATANAAQTTADTAQATAITAQASADSASGLLATASVSSTGIQFNRWGRWGSTANATHVGTGTYDVPHTLGRSNYTVMVTPVLGIANVASKSNNSFRVMIRDHAANLVDRAFDYLMTGQN